MEFARAFNEEAPLAFEQSAAYGSEAGDVAGAAACAA